jgi:glycosyltransferase involved in cell wall biosynthesis
MIDPASPDFESLPVAANAPHCHYRAVNPAAPPAITIVTSLPENGEQLQHTARTVIAQSWQQWEWLIVSDPRSIEPIRAGLKRSIPDGCVVSFVASSASNGVAARNAVVRATGAPFLVFLDSGDLLEPTALEKMLWHLVSYPEYAFATSYSVVRGDSPRLDRDGFHHSDGFFQGRYWRTIALIRRETVATVGDLDESLDVLRAEEDFWLRCARKRIWGATVKEFLTWQPQAGKINEFHHDSTRIAPDIRPRWHQSYDSVPNDLPFENRLRKSCPRVLLVLPWLTTGGSDKFNLDVVDRLVQHHGYEITIATTLAGDQSRMPLYTRLTPDVFVLDHFLRLVDYPRFLRYLIQSRQIDVVLMSHSHLGYQLLPYLRAHCPQATYVDYCHIEEEQWRNGGYPRAAINYGSLLDFTIVSSQHLKDWMIARGGDPQRIEVCYTNIDPQAWAPDPQIRTRVRSELHISESTGVILFAGRLCDQKQPRVFGQVMRRLDENGFDFAALVAGDGEDRPWLERFIRQHHLHGKVTLLGITPYRRVRELMCASDIFFLPSKWEGIALSLFEAMACGLAIVGADVGGQRELVTNDAGILVPRSDPATEARQYAIALERLLVDRAERRARGERARQRILGHFQLKDMGERMVDLLQRAQQFHATQPREVPSPGLGLACATETIEFTRLSGVADRLWQQRNEKLVGRAGMLWTQWALGLGRRGAKARVSVRS